MLIALLEPVDGVDVFRVVSQRILRDGLRRGARRLNHVRRHEIIVKRLLDHCDFGTRSLLLPQRRLNIDLIVLNSIITLTTGEHRLQFLRLRLCRSYFLTFKTSAR